MALAEAWACAALLLSAGATVFTLLDRHADALTASLLAMWCALLAHRYATLALTRADGPRRPTIGL